MRLLLFAHRGEAQEFIKRYGLKPLDERNTLYRNDDSFLCISGEGMLEVFTFLGPLLGELQTKHKISEIINMGVAGALNPDIVLGGIYEVQTSYAFDAEPLFHSFQLECNEDSKKLDCITSGKRVLDDEFSDRLSCFAELVDRELWACAKLCKELGIKLRSYKLVSDFAGTQTDCFDLKHQARDFSSKLLDYYIRHHEKRKDQTLPIEEAQEISDINLNMSFSQKARLKRLSQLLRNRSQFSWTTFLQEQNETLHSKNITEKQKANLLLDQLELELNPVLKEVKKRFGQLCSPLEKIGAHILFDKSFEKKKFKIQMEINDQKNIENLKSALEDLHFRDFEKVWDGELDV